MGWEKGLKPQRLVRGEWKEMGVPRGRPRKRKRKEASIEADCRAHAHARGWTSRKMNGFGFRAWPDRLFIPPVWKRVSKSTSLRQGKTFWVEFKRPGEEPTEEQWRLIFDLRKRGERVYVCHDMEEFIEAFEANSD
jgi:hypothetical protein